MHDLLSIFYDFLPCFLLILWLFVVRMPHGPCVSRVAKVGLKDMACHPSGSYHAPQIPTLVTRCGEMKRSEGPEGAKRSGISEHYWTLLCA